jgi:hypothetical protein
VAYSLAIVSGCSLTRFELVHRPKLLEEGHRQKVKEGMDEKKGEGQPPQQQEQEQEGALLGGEEGRGVEMPRV